MYILALKTAITNTQQNKLKHWHLVEKVETRVEVRGGREGN
jgi:hypothetical protein